MTYPKYALNSTAAKDEKQKLIKVKGQIDKSQWRELLDRN